MNKNTVASSMRRVELRAKAARLYRCTTQSSHTLGVPANVLSQDFSAPRPNQKWAGAVTFLQTTQGWLYLAVVMDLCTCKIIGWATHTRNNADLACNALKAAIARRGAPRGVIMHTDRGSVYYGWPHRDLIRQYGHVASKSGRGNCYDNEWVEGFFHTLRVESIHGEPLVSPGTLRRQLFEYIEDEYSRTRCHSALGCISPDEFEAQIAT